MAFLQIHFLFSFKVRDVRRGKVDFQYIMSMQNRLTHFFLCLSIFNTGYCFIFLLLLKAGIWIFTSLHMNVNYSYSVIEKKKVWYITHTAFFLFFFFQENQCSYYGDLSTQSRVREDRISGRIAVYHQSKLGSTQTWYIIHKGRGKCFTVFTSNLLCLYKCTRASRILTDHITCFSIVKKNPNNQT